MKAHSPISIRHKLQSLSLFLVLTTSILGMATTLLFSLRMEYQNLDRNLMNSAQVLAQSPDVADFLAHRADSSVLTHYLNGTISRVQDIDAIVVADHNGVIRYCPDPAFVGTVYPDVDTLTVLRGELTEVDTGAGISGAEHRALAAVHDLDGSLLGFVSVGIGVRSVHQIVLDTVGCFAILTFLAAGVALVLSRNLSSSIKEALLGYEPDAFRQMFHQREDILETLKEGVIAIDKDTNVIYVNSAGLRLLNAQQPSDVLGRPLKELYPDTLLPRLLTTGKPEYNVHLQHVPGSKAALSDRMPIWEDDKIVGAVAIFQDRTEATAMAEELTGVRHLVEAMRAYTHEFINKLHIILGMIQLGQVEQAEQYILDISQIHHQSVSRVMSQIEDTAVAALLVGKTSRAAELGINLHLDPRSTLSADGRFLPSGVLVTILGNLIENATESLDRSTWKQKEIAVSIREKPDSLLLCVEDTGPGILPELLPFILNPTSPPRETGTASACPGSGSWSTCTTARSGWRASQNPGPPSSSPSRRRRRSRQKRNRPPTRKGERHAGNLSGRDRGGRPHDRLHRSELSGAGSPLPSGRQLPQRPGRASLAAAPPGGSADPGRLYAPDDRAGASAGAALFRNHQRRGDGHRRQ